jgi:foldase protein PrsA
MRKSLFGKGVLLAALLALLLAACSSRKVEVLATVNGEEITRRDLDEVLKMVRLVSPDVDAMLEDQGFKEYFEDTFLRMLVDNALISGELQRLELQVEAAKLEEVYTTFRSQLLEELYQDEDTLGQRLKELQLDEEAIKKLLRGEVAANTLFEHVVEELSDEELRKYAEDNGLLQVAGSVEAFHILLKEEGEALEALERLRRGEDFGQLAKELSACPSGDNRQGGLGRINENDPNWDADFRAAAFALEEDRVSDPVKTQFGWHLILVKERRDAYTKDFEEEKAGLRLDREEKLINDYFKNLWDKAEIEFFL